MLNRTRVVLLALALLLAGFGIGVARLVRLRFEAGDIYPPYSSFRADPLGTKALFDSLADLRGVNPKRHVQHVTRLPSGHDATLFVFGADLQGLADVPDFEFNQLDQFLHQGGRIVVTFYPTSARPDGLLHRSRRPGRDPDAEELREQNPDEKRERGNGTGPAVEEPRTDSKTEKEQSNRTRRTRRGFPGDDENAGRSGRLVSLHEKWGVAFDYVPLPHDDEGAPRSVTARATGGGNLPPTLTWHTALCFDRLATNWIARYERDERPVLVERRYGAGSLVLAADSYFVSNEALRKERHPGLLAWLVGPGHEVIFDEAHLGVREEPGIAGLLRQYRLEGLLAGLALLAGLFIWKHSVPFVPPPDDEAEGAAADPVAGRDSAAGFVNLLRRSIPPSDILTVCFTEWKKSCGQGRAELATQVGHLVSGGGGTPQPTAPARHPVTIYREVATLVNRRTAPGLRHPERSGRK